MSAPLFDWLKFAIMTPLQERVTGLGVCSKCHTKTLAEKCSNEAGRWLQCSKCLTVFVSPPDSGGVGNGDR